MSEVDNKDDSATKPVEKSGPGETKNFSVPSSAETQSGQRRPFSVPGFPPSAFDFSSMTDLLNVLFDLCP